MWLFMLLISIVAGMLYYGNWLIMFVINHLCNSPYSDAPIKQMRSDVCVRVRSCIATVSLDYRWHRDMRNHNSIVCVSYACFYNFPPSLSLSLLPFRVHSQNMKM